MKTKTFGSLIIGLLLVPAFVSAEVSATSTGTTSPSIKNTFATCSQTALEKRETRISTARTAYNDAMKQALEIRKTALGAALAVGTTTERIGAKKAAYDAYKHAQENAQSAFSTARRDAWITFENDMKACRDAKKADQQKKLVEKKIEEEKKKDSHRKEIEDIKNSKKERKEGNSTTTPYHQ